VQAQKATTIHPRTHTSHTFVEKFLDYRKSKNITAAHLIGETRNQIKAEKIKRHTAGMSPLQLSSITPSLAC
jgi:hypothetical protein